MAREKLEEVTEKKKSVEKVQPLFHMFNAVLGIGSGGAGNGRSTFSPAFQVHEGGFAKVPGSAGFCPSIAGKTRKTCLA